MDASAEEAGGATQAKLLHCGIYLYIPKRGFAATIVPTSDVIQALALPALVPQASRRLF